MNGPFIFSNFLLPQNRDSALYKRWRVFFPLWEVIFKPYLKGAKS
eukprot:UN06524